MGLTLDISLDKDIREIDAFFDDLKFKAVVTAARQSLNRTATRTRSNAIRELRKRRKAKIREYRQMVKVFRAKGGILTELEARIEFKDIPLPLIWFISGRAEPKAQRLPNARRKPRRFEIVQGQKKARPGVFVQKAKKGKMRYQAFRRRDPNKLERGFVKQSVPSIAEFLSNKTRILGKIENHSLATLQVEYDRTLKHQLDKLHL